MYVEQKNRKNELVMGLDRKWNDNQLGFWLDMRLGDSILGKRTIWKH